MGGVLLVRFTQTLLPFGSLYRAAGEGTSLTLTSFGLFTVLFYLYAFWSLYLHAMCLTRTCSVYRFMMLAFASGHKFDTNTNSVFIVEAKHGFFTVSLESTVADLLVML